MVPIIEKKKITAVMIRTRLIYPCLLEVSPRISGAATPITSAPITYASPLIELKLFLSFISSVITGRRLFSEISMTGNNTPSRIYDTYAIASFPDVDNIGPNQSRRKLALHRIVPRINVGRKCPIFLVGRWSIINPTNGSLMASRKRAIMNSVAHAAGLKPHILV